MTWNTKTWRENYSETWLAKSNTVAALDAWVRRTLANHRRLDVSEMESVAPWSVETLARSVGEFGDSERWPWCVAAIALLQELIFCAEGGGMDAVGGVVDHNDLADVIKTLRAIRNVALHPAFQIDRGENPTPMERLITLLEEDDDIEVSELALRMPAAWSYFAEKPVATYALRKLHAAGELFVERNRILKRSASG